MKPLGLLCLFLLTAAAVAQTAHYRREGKVVLNDLKATPGATDKELTRTKLCDPTFHTATARNVTEGTKKKVCAEYGIAQGCPGAGYEIDHLISIELGGSNDISNLWPQPAEPVPGFHQKDVLENRLHKMVCAGEISLAKAQALIADDWYSAYRRYVQP